MSLVTVENCGDDFLASLADATQPTDDWDDLKGIDGGGEARRRVRLGAEQRRGGGESPSPSLPPSFP